jgi:phosphohistidine phosphatase SixA
MDAKKILLMRHAEKPAKSDDPNLSKEGRDRAQKLVQYIPATFGKPNLLFASAISEESARPYQTLKPLSDAIGVDIDDKFADHAYAELASEILSNSSFNGKLLVICWHHQRIPSFAKALGAKPNDYPDPWDPSVFNLILQFEYVNTKPKVTRVTEPF